MSWPKGKQRGTSPNKGKSLGPILDIKASMFEEIARDVEAAPEQRFSTMFQCLTNAMASSRRKDIREAAAVLERFWNEDMVATVIHTPGWKKP